MIKIIKALKRDKKFAFEIAGTLSAWFNEEGLRNMKIDFEMNQVLVAKNESQVVGFLCYTTCAGKILLLWMGVALGFHEQGIGSKLLKFLENEGKKLGSYAIEVETLPDEDDYLPYKKTRDFYYENGFERILYKKARVAGWDDQIVLEKKLT